MNDGIYQFGVNKKKIVASSDDKSGYIETQQTGINCVIPVDIPIRSIIAVIKERKNTFSIQTYQQMIALLLLLNIYHVYCPDDSLDDLLLLTIENVSNESLNELLKVLEDIELSKVTFSLNREQYKDTRDTAIEIWILLARVQFIREIE